MRVELKGSRQITAIRNRAAKTSARTPKTARVPVNDRVGLINAVKGSNCIWMLLDKLNITSGGFFNCNLPLSF
ncbi:hypothetical protein Hanom_Chr11g01009771 [Helianthus anomalus]